MIKLNLEIDIKKSGPEHKQVDLIEKVCDYIQVCESDVDSYHHWNYLKLLYKKLNSRQLPKQYYPMMDKLTEFLLKHASYDSGENQVQIEGSDIFKYKTADEDK